MPDKMFDWAKSHLRDLALFALIIITSYDSVTTNYALLTRQVDSNTTEIAGIKEVMFTTKDAKHLVENLQLNFDNVNLKLVPIADDIREVRDEVKTLRK